jgi:hypothetical protein
MSSTSFPARLKRDGNINRIKDLVSNGCSVGEIRDCFAHADIHLVVGHHDIPLLANLDELERKALPARCVKNYLSNRQEDTGPKPATE